MYKVLLAEDEVQVLSAMLTAIPWKKHGFEVPLGCRDGQKAMEALRNGFVPNLVIADICMPFVDGLELTKFIGEKLPDAMTVILTGYDEFRYAQEAIRLKVFDYILKPVTPNRMAELLNKFRHELDERELHHLESTMGIVSSYFLNQMVTRRLEPSTIRKYCLANRLSFPGAAHAVAILDVDLPSPATPQEISNLELMRYGLFNIAQELAQKSGRAVCFQGKDGTTCLIVNGAAGETEALARQLARSIAKSLRSCLGITASAGIGAAVSDLGELRRSRTQAAAALGYRFFYGDASIISEADVSIEQSEGIDYGSCEKQMIRAIQNMDRKSAGDAVARLKEQLRKNRLPFDRCVLYSLEMMMRIVTLTNKVTGEMDADSMEKIVWDSDLHKLSSLDRLMRQLQNVCDRAFEILEAVRNYTISSQVAKAENYIRDHYSDPELSLNRITEHLAISTSYFSAIFKSKTGSTFVEYLTRIRMEKAKRLLVFTDRRTYEIADQVGFSDPHYFSVAFKRVAGVTPKEYRERTAGKGKQGASV